MGLLLTRDNGFCHLFAPNKLRRRHNTAAKKASLPTRLLFLMQLRLCVYSIVELSTSLKLSYFLSFYRYNLTCARVLVVACRTF